MKKLILILTLLISSSSFALTQDEANNCPRPSDEILNIITEAAQKTKSLDRKYLVTMSNYMDVIRERAENCDQLVANVRTYTVIVGEAAETFNAKIEEATRTLEQKLTPFIMAD